MVDHIPCLNPECQQCRESWSGMRVMRNNFITVNMDNEGNAYTPWRLTPDTFFRWNNTVGTQAHQVIYDVPWRTGVEPAPLPPEREYSLRENIARAFGIPVITDDVQVAREERERADVTAIEERTATVDDHGFTGEKTEANTETTTEEAGAEATGEVAEISWQDRLAKLIDLNNTDYPIEIEGPHGERYVSAFAFRSVLLAAQAEMGWCAPGANEALRRMGQPELNVPANGGANGELRCYTVTGTVTDETRNGVRHRELLSSHDLKRNLEVGVSPYTRQHSDAEHPWTVELGERRTVTRRHVTFEGDEEVSATEEVRNFQPVTITLWARVANVLGNNPLTKEQENNIVLMAVQMAHYTRAFSWDGAPSNPETMAQGKFEVTITPIPEPEGGLAGAPINDLELRDTYVRASGRPRRSLRGHG